MSAERDDGLVIQFMVDAITTIFYYTADQTLDTFLANRMMRDAVAKNLEVLGESANNLSPALIVQESQIPWSDVIGLRHRLVHHYGGTDWAVVWETIRIDLPPLLDRLIELQTRL
ncbi:DUF86 domain-containing protein [Sulfobacillus thermosulfidooxidans]|uniref:DUF86 domain-containing protein n=1 Tax=Sulfobacillus thermosulfidooxidans TaxID=28034 RepID=A0A2T2X0D6_SULTH|nr:HepT-like ribonuclease domain-containing protein [Sulfobacillus thermosulfidooxidans]PSR27936.1 MAG: DUF86 domain-containing protein [Sulfobacillus thermosulfidooxidans]